MGGNAASGASNLSELQLTRGAISLAIKAAQQSVEFADKSEDEFHRVSKRTTLADAQHQAGDLTESHRTFKEAETLQKERQADYPQLYSLSGFCYCDLLLTAGEWIKSELSSKLSLELQIPIKLAEPVLVNNLLANKVDAVAKVNTVDGASLSTLQQAKDWLDQAVEGLRKAGVEDYIIRGLLARACYYRFVARMEPAPLDSNVRDNGDDASRVSLALNTGYRSAIRDLQEVHDIAQRGGMRLFLTDYHLETARLILSTDANQTLFKLNTSEHLQQARQLIEETGYKRRLPELAYLEDFMKSS